MKKHKNLNEYLPFEIYLNKITNRIVFKINTGYKLELLTPETMRLLRSTKKDVDTDKNGQNVPKLESVEVVLVRCNLVKNYYIRSSKVLFTFAPNKQFGWLINISPNTLTMMSTVNTGFSYIEVWFTDQNSKAPENYWIVASNVQKPDIQQNQDLENMLKVTAFCHLLKNVVINMVKN